MIAGLYYQVEANTVYTPLAANLLSLCFCYALYDLSRYFAVGKINNIAVSAFFLTPSDDPSMAISGAGPGVRNGIETSYTYDPSDEIHRGGGREGGGDISDDDDSTRSGPLINSSSQSLDSASLLTSRHRTQSRLSRQKTIDKRTADSVHLTQALRDASHFQEDGGGGGATPLSDTSASGSTVSGGAAMNITQSTSRYSVSLSYSSQLSGGSSRNSLSQSYPYTTGDEEKDKTRAMHAKK